MKLEKNKDAMGTFQITTKMNKGKSFKKATMGQCCGAVGYITICDVGILYLEAGSCPRNFVFQSNFLPTHLGRQQITAQVLGPLPTTEESPDGVPESFLISATIWQVSE